jgi:hypothetical protein
MPRQRGPSGEAARRGPRGGFRTVAALCGVRVGPNVLSLPVGRRKTEPDQRVSEWSSLIGARTDSNSLGLSSDCLHDERAGAAVRACHLPRSRDKASGNRPKRHGLDDAVRPDSLGGSR